MTYKSLVSITTRVALVALGNVYFGYSLAYYGITQDSIVYLLGYENSDNKAVIDGLINAVLPIGAALGAFSSVKLTQSLGFRKSFIVCDLLGIINAVGSLFLNYTSLFITRFVYGVFVGINSSLTPQYIQQFSPIQLSGMMGSFCNVGLLVGLTVAFILSWIFLQETPSQYDSSKDYGSLGFNSWRVMFGFPIVTCVLRLMAFASLYTEDLPKETYRKGQTDKTKQQLQEIYEENYVETALEEFKAEDALQGGKPMTYGDLFDPQNLRRFVVASALSFLNQWCGINAINFYAVTIFKEISDGNFTWVNVLTVMDGVVSIFASLASGYIINRFGRRFMFLVGNGVCAFSLSVLTALYTVINASHDYSESTFKLLQWLIIIFVFMFIISFSMSLGPVFWVYMSEVCPPKGIGLVVLQNWLSLALLAQFFPIIVEKTQLSICFGVFAVFSLLGEFFIYFEVKETKELTKAQIHALFVRSERYQSGAQTSLVAKSYKEVSDY